MWRIYRPDKKNQHNTKGLKLRGMSRIRKEVDINNIIKRRCLNFEER